VAGGAGIRAGFALLQGAGSHWSDMLGLLPSEPKVTYTRNGEKVKELPADYYSSKDFTDFIIQSIDENGRTASRSSPTSPTRPRTARWPCRTSGGTSTRAGTTRGTTPSGGAAGPAEEAGDHRQGRGHVPAAAEHPAWDKLTDEERRLAARKMELYAAMIEYMDDQIGRLIDHLKKAGKYDNTLIVFISDNGAAGEDMAELVTKLAPEAKDWFDKTFDNRPENWGRPGSCVEYGPAWAQVSSVPFRLFKGVVAEGGIRAPLIVSGPGVKHEGAINHSVLHVMDIMPTFLESAGVEHPAKKRGSKVAPPQGKSMWPLLAGREQAIRTDSDWLGWELFGNRAIRQGDWKLLYLLKGAGGTGDWELFNFVKTPPRCTTFPRSIPTSARRCSNCGMNT
jgi:arylsulfatase A-like enzyme